MTFTELWNTSNEYLDVPNRVFRLPHNVPTQQPLVRRDNGILLWNISKPVRVYYRYGEMNSISYSTFE